MVLSMDRWVGKVAVVTGASGGIGAAIAEALVEHGLKVAALARRKNILDDMAKKLIGKRGKLYPVKADVSKEEEVQNAFKWVRETLGPVHVLVNNAGIAIGKDILDGDVESWKKIWNVNVLGLCVATNEAVREMRARNIDGHIIHINSILGHQVFPFPGISVYPSSKFAVTALAEKLRMELNSVKSKIKITSISPGLVETNILPDEYKSSQSYKDMVEQGAILDPVDIADGVIYVLSTPPNVQIQELTIRPVIETY